MSGPLADLKILDFTTLLPGPYATQLLADMGASVLRVETPLRPDSVDAMSPKVGTQSAARATLNRNKQSLALNLKTQKAQDIICRLIADYDVLIEQFRPGVMQRLGLDYNALSAINPRLIYCSISGYGQTGPLKGRAGHDINYLALSGLASFSGRKDTGPVLSGTQIADIAGGSHHAVMGILAAVNQRHITGKGQSIDISMSDAALALTTLFGANYLAGGDPPSLATELLNGGIFYGYYRTCDERYLAIGSLEPQFTQELFTGLGKPEWVTRAQETDPQLQAQLIADIATIIADKPLVHWKACFAEKDACVEPVLTLDEVQEHEHFRARKMFVQVPCSDGLFVTQIGSPLKFSGSVQDCPHISSTIGENTASVLLKYGFSEEEIEVLLRESSIY